MLLNTKHTKLSELLIECNYNFNTTRIDAVKRWRKVTELVIVGRLHIPVYIKNLPASVAINFFDNGLLYYLKYPSNWKL